MLLELVSFALLGYVGYTTMYPDKASTTLTSKLNANMDNGFQYRDVTYADSLDLMHPDVRNNSLVTGASDWVAKDRGLNGVPRAYVRQIPGTSQMAQLYRTDNLFL